MRYTVPFIIVLYLLSFSENIFPNQSSSTNSQHEATLIPSPTNVLVEKKISYLKIGMLTGFLATMLYTQYTTLITSIKKSPFPYTAAFLCFLHYSTDTIAKYYQIKHKAIMQDLSKKMYRYVIYATAIKNTMMDLSKKNNSCYFFEDDFCHDITCQIPLSFDELELLSQDLLQNCFHPNHDINMIETDIEEKLFVLSKEHIKIEDILELYKEDIEFYPYLKSFYQNPLQNYKKTVTKLNNLVKNHLHKIINNESYL